MLLKGLECSEVRLSELARDGATRRIDAEFFSQRFIKNEEALLRSGLSLERLVEVTTKIDVGHVGPMAHEYCDDGIPLLQTQNIQQFSIKPFDAVRITDRFHHLLRKSQVFPGDCLIARSGSIGNAAFVTDADPQPLNSADIIIVRADSTKITNGYLAGFLNSRAGALQIERLSSGGVQGHINLKAIEHLMVPMPSRPFQTAVHRTVLRGLEQRRSSLALLNEAEELLAVHLGLKDLVYSGNATYTQTSVNVRAAGRMDAEFFSPKVSSLLSRLRADGLTIGDVAMVRPERFSPSQQGVFRYIEISSLNGDGSTTSEEIPMIQAPSRATSYVRRNDVITSTVRPIRRLSAQITEELDGAVCSSGFVVLKPIKVPSELLLMYLRLPPICELMDLYTSASMYPAIAERDILKLPFRRVTADVEREVVEAVRKSREARADAEQLLERAKRAVVVAIEETEAAALEFLSVGVA